MKSTRLTSAAAITMFAVLAMSLRLAAQDDQNHKLKHHHYKVIDIGTFGGPSSFFNTLGLSDAFGFNCCFYGIAPVLNKQGTLAGWADTSTQDPYPGFCFDPDCFVAHAFLWHKSVKTDLGVLPGGASSAALWINSNGLATGYSQNGEIDPLLFDKPEVRAVVWEQGGITDLGTLGGNESNASAINNRGQVAGEAQNTIPDPYSFFYVLFNGSSNGTQTRAFLWDKDYGMQDLGTLGGPDASANLVNDRGQVAGASYTNSTPNSTTGLPTFHPFLWDREKGIQDLGSLGGTALGSVNSINERGEVVGATTTAGDVYVNPFLWNGTKMINLVAPPFVGDANGEAAWINDAGEVVGFAAIPGACPGGIVGHAFLWKNGTIRDLGALSGNPNSAASFINSKAQIVGRSSTCDLSSGIPFLWENGSMADVNALIPSNSPFHLYATPFIDDRGVIGAFGILGNGDTHALLLVPCDENRNDDEDCEGAAANADLEADHVIAPQSAGCRFGRHCGYCDVGSNGTLNGECVSSRLNSCYIKPSPNCPVGKRPIKPTNYACGIGLQPRVDLARACSF